MCSLQGYNYLGVLRKGERQNGESHNGESPNGRMGTMGVRPKWRMTIKENEHLGEKEIEKRNSTFRRFIYQRVSNLEIEIMTASP